MALAFWQQNHITGSYPVCGPTQCYHLLWCPPMLWTGLDFSFLASILCFPEFCLTNIKTLLQFIGVILNSESVHQFACVPLKSSRKDMSAGKNCLIMAVVLREVWLPWDSQYTWGGGLDSQEWQNLRSSHTPPVPGFIHLCVLMKKNRPHQKRKRKKEHNRNINNLQWS